jgi:hypothetical protein
LVREIGDEGRLVYPIKGNPPPCPEGYVRDPGNLWQFIPDVPCKHREERTISEDCCVPYIQLYCLHFDKPIVLKDCKYCDAREN